MISNAMIFVPSVVFCLIAYGTLPINGGSFKQTTGASCKNRPDEFFLSPAPWWTCSDHPLICFNNLTMGVLSNLSRKECRQRAYLDSSIYGSNYQQQSSAFQTQSNFNSVRPYISANAPQRNSNGNSINNLSPSNSNCPQPVWSAEMDRASNVLLQKSQRCQFDYGTLLTLFELVDKMVQQSRRCLQSQKQPLYQDRGFAGNPLAPRRSTYGADGRSTYGTDGRRIVYFQEDQPLGLDGYGGDHGAQSKRVVVIKSDKTKDATGIVVEDSKEQAKKDKKDAMQEKKDEAQEKKDEAQEAPQEAPASG